MTETPLIIKQAFLNIYEATHHIETKSEEERVAKEEILSNIFTMLGTQEIARYDLKRGFKLSEAEIKYLKRLVEEDIKKSNAALNDAKQQNIQF